MSAVASLSNPSAVIHVCLHFGGPFYVFFHATLELSAEEVVNTLLPLHGQHRR